MQEPRNSRPPNVPGARVERYGLLGPRPWRSPGDPRMRPAGVAAFAVATAVALAAYAWFAAGGGAPTAWTLVLALAVIATDVTELPLTTGTGGSYKIVLNDILVLVPFATLPAHQSAWLLLLATCTSWLLLPLSWSMRFAHVASGLAYRSILLAAATVALALDSSPYVAVAAMLLASVAYEFTLFWPFAHVLLYPTGRSWRRFVRDATQVQAMVVAVELPIALAAVAAWESAPWTIPLLAVPILVSWRLALLGPRMRELREAELARARFTSMASHELQTPITSIVGFTSTLDDRWDDLPADDRRRFLRIVHDQGQRLSRLVAQLLELSNMDAAHAATTTEPVDVASAVEHAVRDSASDPTDIRVDVPVGLAVQATHDDLVRILVNLLTNANKYGRPPVTVRATRAGGRWSVLEVTDHGDGVDPSDVPTLFDHFARGADVPSNVDGSGLGLAIARSVARIHGGELSYEPRPGGAAGACFHVRLRSAPQVGTPRSTPESRSSDTSRTGTIAPSATAAGSSSSSTGE